MQYFANMQTQNALSFFFEWCMMMQKSTVEFDFTFFTLSSLIVYIPMSTYSRSGKLQGMGSGKYYYVSSEENSKSSRHQNKSKIHQ